MKTFPLHVLAPERTFFDGACTSLTVPSIDGIYGLMAQHEDIVLAIVPGKLTLRDADGVEQIAAVSEGVLFFFFFNDPATTEIYTLPLHDALPI